MKKPLSFVMAMVLIVVSAVPALALDGSGEMLRFDSNGDLTILHLTDWHTSFPMPSVQRQFVIEALAETSPDLVVLGGDMSEASREDQPEAVKEICDLMIEADVPFVITFGNHDYLHDLSIDEMFALYKEYGGAYCLSEDEDPSLFGCGTCSVPVYSHDGSRVAYNIYCFDSGCEYNRKFDAPSAGLTRSDRFSSDAESVITANYDSVHPDQIEWYREKAEESKDANSGKYVPAVVFQHIIVQEIYDMIWPAAKESDSRGLMRFEKKTYKMTAVPNLSCIKDGYILERPCPGYYNYGQMDAMKANGDVKAVFCGHDHSNSFTVDIDGIDVVNTPSVKPHSFFKKLNWGGRVITLHEDGSYDSRVLTGCELAEKSGSAIVSSGTLSRAELVFSKVWRSFVDISLLFWKPVTKLFFK